MAGIEILFTNARLADGSLKDIGVAEGRIVSMDEGPVTGQLACNVWACGEQLHPGFPGRATIRAGVLEHA